MKYPEYPTSAVTLEETILDQWRAEKLFARTLQATEGAPEFVFYEGPPTANGRPGIHHVISRTIKDMVCRHRSMRGFHVTRIAGWDAHGLPVEIEAEKKLGISGKRQIEEIGVARFNQVCRDSVFTYKEDWERLSERIGYWLDYSKPYVTFTPEYIESVWAILKQLADRDLFYRGHKSVPYCPRCGTALSSHEVAQGYEDVSDPSLYFFAPIVNDGGETDGRAFLVWTTTPWTLPSNVGLALHAGLAYVEVEWPGTDRRIILAEARKDAVLGEARVLRRYTAKELEALRYRAPFDIVPVEEPERAWKVVLEPFVTAEDGTGIVHLAPAFGADDYASGQRHGLPMLRPVDDAGRFVEGTALVGGQFVKDADVVLVEDLKKRGLVFRATHETHSYPHCWRCGSPLLYMARDSWFLRTTAVRDVMVEHNRGIDWHPPEIGSNRFGEWLEGNIDWAISRERYWGTPLPAWVCTKQSDHVEFIGSLADLDARAGGLAAGFDPHKPYIDEIHWPCSRCDGTMKRTPEVIDAWFDSGSMPYAQWHYPFENEDLFRRYYPADFICEGIDQTRGWFYSLLAIATMLGHDAPFRAVVVNDMILDAEGLKMAKSKGNVVDPWQAIAEFGADAIRWHMVTVSQPWATKRFDTAALTENVRRTFDTLANTYRFFALYAGLSAYAPSEADPAAADRPLMDRWVLSRLEGLVNRVGAEMEQYEVTRAARAVGEFIVDDLSNWYVRRSRPRFWGTRTESQTDALRPIAMSGPASPLDAGDRHNGTDASEIPVDMRAAFATLHEVLATVARLLAPVVPFHADWLYRALCGTSVHLAAWPVPVKAQASARNPTLERGMEAARELVRLGRAARELARIRVRQPLRALHAVVPQGSELDGALLAVVEEELNIKQVIFLSDAEDLVTHRATPNFRELGKRFGARTQQAAAAIRALPSSALATFMRGGGLEIDLDGETHALEANHVDVREEARGDLVVEADGAFTVALDPTIDDALRLEGLARELVNRIQRLRREGGLAVSDRIRLFLYGGEPIRETVSRHGDVVARETLAISVETGDQPPERAHHAFQKVELDGVTAWIALDPA